MSLATAADAASAAVIRHDAAGIATLTLNRPERYNTLAEETITALSQSLEAIAGDASVRVVVIASTGKAFSTGHDMKQMRANRNEAYLKKLLADCSAMMQAIVRLPQPVIAQVQGIATAAGCQLVASCDLAIAAQSSRFATSGINYGLFCATPAVALSRTVARKHALEMLFTGNFVDAETAARIGLINRAVPDERLEAEVLELATAIARKSGYAVKLGKASYYAQADQPLDAAYRCASADLVRNLLAKDGVEGVDAFFEKREPKFEQD
ncbi:MAG: enoyl-CoA hydratase [Gammaproteobacteria bacterium]|nr:enoyl-CoA hydratase [Gammaproteobacteria bacterium]MBI5617610.1 enoyl-CoA hydratase [Gammaproteobacteria bacterium]